MKNRTGKGELKREPSEKSQQTFSEFRKRIPDDFPGLSDPTALQHVYRIVPDILSGKRISFEYEYESETVYLLRNDLTRLQKILTGLVREYRINPVNVAVFREKEGQFLLIVTRLSPNSDQPEAGIEEADWMIPGGDGTNRSASSVTFEKKSSNPRIMGLQVVNISSLTLVNNLFETIDGQRWSSVWILMRTRVSRRLKYLYRVRLRFERELKGKERASLACDFERYLQPLIRARSLFDIIGPAMVGPSSSHTAGANRIGRIGRNILAALVQSGRIRRINRLEVKLLGSFRDTGVGHHCPQALAAGLCGLDAADPRLIERGARLIKERGILDFAGLITRFNGFKKGSREEDDFYIKENNSNIAEIIAETDSGLFTLTGFSLGSGNVEVRYVNGSKLKHGFITGKTNIFLDVAAPGLAESGNSGIPVSALDAVDSVRKHSENDRLPFNTFEEMLEAFSAGTASDELITGILTVEEGISGLSAAAARQKMDGYWRIMEGAIQAGLEQTDRSSFGLSGGDSARLAAFETGNHSEVFGSGLHSRALRYAIAVNEVNAGSGLIVACPTGGACGLLPGILKAWEETRADLALDRRRGLIIDALFVAGQLGMVLFDDVPTAGAVLGCQAEVGGAAAMSAAALTFLQQGNLEQILAAFTLSLKNCMGLVCDPVAGLVEVPCVKRNGLYSSLAISAAQLALSGVCSRVSTDEVVLAVREVGERLHGDYKETARGGLATTRDGKKVAARFQEINRLFFSDDS